jgi:hypothetical protein
MGRSILQKALHGAATAGAGYLGQSMLWEKQAQLQAARDETLAGYRSAERAEDRQLQLKEIGLREQEMGATADFRSKQLENQQATLNIALEQQKRGNLSAEVQDRLNKQLFENEKAINEQRQKVFALPQGDPRRDDENSLLLSMMKMQEQYSHFRLDTPGDLTTGAAGEEVAITYRGGKPIYRTTASGELTGITEKLPPGGEAQRFLTSPSPEEYKNLRPGDPYLQRIDGVWKWATKQ